MEQRAGSMVLLAIFVSRFEAQLIAGMLHGYGIHTSVDGEAHASAEYISLALGGHRLRVPAGDYQAASDILREAGVLDHDVLHRRLRSPLLWLIGGVFGFVGGTSAGMVALGAPVWLLLMPLFSALSIPVDPRGRPDYFLAAPSD